MGKLATAERVSRDSIRQLRLPAVAAGLRPRGRDRIGRCVGDRGQGTGYGIELVAPHCDRFVTVDKYAAGGDRHAANVEFRRMCVPPLGFGDESFDFVITFQVIEHIDDDAAFVREIARVLRPGGRLILTTPNAPMSLTRNPWHVREYRIDELRRLLSEAFSAVETYGVFGNERVMDTTNTTAAAWSASPASTCSTSSTAYDARARDDDTHTYDYYVRTVERTAYDYYVRTVHVRTDDRPTPTDRPDRTG